MKFIAMWSGPRNISTAMMRSWENRPDTAVWDEPLYGHYLVHTGLDHPGRDEVISACETEWAAVVDRLTTAPRGADIFFQKHMAHHLLPHIDSAWLAQVDHAFLIREPREMITSFIRNIPNPSLSDFGLQQQWNIFERVRKSTGHVPPVIDARDVLQNPAAVLRALCTALDVPFSEHMLSWPAGPRDSDGIWAKHWYTAVEQSTGFQPYRSKPDVVPPALNDLHDACGVFYDKLRAHRITG
jgi:hypothetical protein